MPIAAAAALVPSAGAGPAALRPVPGDDLVLAYPEGIHVRYLGWLCSGATPAAPFGLAAGHLA